MNQKKRIDWERIEPEWRAGIKSVLQIAEEHGVSHTAINKHFKKLGIERDLSAKIKSKADSLVSKALVSTRVSTETSLNDSLIIDAHAHRLADIDLEHHSGCEKTRRTFNALHDEFDKLSSDNEPLEKRISTFQKLVSTQETLYMMERKIVKLDSVATNNDSIESILKRLS